MDELIYIGMAHAAFIAVFLLSKENKSLSDKLLIGWFIILAMPLIGKALSPSMLNVPVPILNINLVYPLAFGPFLWLYLKSLTEQITTISWQESFHFLPFLCLFFYNWALVILLTFLLQNLMSTRTLLASSLLL